MAVITISRQYGAGGSTLGRMIADKLGYTFADSTIIERIAHEANVSTSWVQSFEKEAGGRMSRFVSGMVARHLVDRILKDERGYLDEQTYLDYLVLIIAQMADEGNCVIIGRGSQYILNDHPEAFHLLLVDSPANRVRFLVEHHKFTEKKAALEVEREDKRRMALYQRLGKTDYDDPMLYHMVLNMGRVDLDTALDLACRAVNL